jgi:hypothetical protein
MTQRTWQRGPFPEKLGPAWQQPMSYITHSQWWADYWAKLGCEVVEITEATSQQPTAQPHHTPEAPPQPPSADLPPA